MNLLATVILMLGTCFLVHVEGDTLCYECADCTRRPSVTDDVCATQHGFCFTATTSDNRTKRGCSEEHVKYAKVGCFMTEATQQENKTRVCRCDLRRCNVGFAPYKDVDTNTTCEKCSDCPRMKTSTNMTADSCLTNGGFCFTDTTSDGRIDRGCSEDLDRYHSVGCVNWTSTLVKDGVKTEWITHGCRCDESYCNSNHYGQDDEATNSIPRVDFEVPWWLILIFVVFGVIGTVVPILVCCCICGVPALFAGMLIGMSQENRVRARRGFIHRPAPSAPNAPRAPPAPSASPV